MKKKIAVLTLALCMTFTAAACSNQNEETQTEDSTSDTSQEESGNIRLTTVAAEDMDKYITLAEYKGVTVESSVPEVTEADIDSQIATSLEEVAEEVTDADAVIQEGDIANIDYEGTLNGEAFDGGSDTGYDLTIGSGSFIDGFEDGLIGAKTGEERDLNLTFPEEYPSEELAGQDVVFHVTVNSIKRPPELTDEWVKENTGYEDVAAYRDSVRANLEASNEASAQSTAQTDAWYQVYDNSEVIEYPEEDIQKEIDAYNGLMTDYAEQNNMTLEELIEAQGITQDEYDEQCQQYAESMVKQNLVVQAILDNEGLTLEGEKGQAALENLLASYSMETKEELVEQYGELAVNESIGVTIAGDFVAENANIENVIETSDDKNGVDGDAEEAASNS